MREIFNDWVDSLPEGFWDDCADACGILSTMETSFKAGWDAAHKRLMPEESGPAVEAI